jgi:hypothetical protein
MVLTKIVNKSGISSNVIKIIAIIAMTIDHCAWTFFPGFRTDFPIILLHIIGRLTVPIMIFCIVEGYYHTKNIKNYILRLFIFAFISHFAYALLLTPGKLNMLSNNHTLDLFKNLKNAMMTAWKREKRQGMPKRLFLNGRTG